jgi:hypothetical protein
MNELLEKTQCAPAMKVVSWDQVADTVVCASTDATELYSVQELEAHYPHIRQGLRAAQCITGGNMEKMSGLLEEWGALLRQPTNQPPLLDKPSMLSGYQLGWLARWIELEVREFDVKIKLRKCVPGDASVGKDTMSGYQITLGCSKKVFAANFPKMYASINICDDVGMSGSAMVPVLRSMILDQLRYNEAALPNDLNLMSI